MSDIIVYEGSVRVGLVQNLVSVQWMECYRAPGEVKLVVAATEENRALLVVGNRLYHTEGRTLMRIEQVELSDRAGQAQMVVRGRCGAAMLERRVVMATVNVTRAEAGMYKLLHDNLRGLPLGLAADKGLIETADSQQCWGSVLERVQALAEGSGLGFRVVFNPAATGIRETFEVYRGVDRSASGRDYVGYFSDETGDVSRLELLFGNAEHRNVAVVAGCEEDSGREVVWVSPQDVLGEARREVFADGKALRRRYQQAHDTGRRDEQNNPIFTYTMGSYTNAEYLEVLRAYGQEALDGRQPRSEIKVEITEGALRFGVDYGLGDRLPVRLAAYGLTVSARVEAVTFVAEAGGQKTVVSLYDYAAAE